MQQNQEARGEMRRDVSARVIKHPVAGDLHVAQPGAAQAAPPWTSGRRTDSLTHEAAAMPPDVRHTLLLSSKLSMNWGA